MSLDSIAAYTNSDSEGEAEACNSSPRVTTENSKANYFEVVDDARSSDTESDHDEGDSRNRQPKQTLTQSALPKPNFGAVTSSIGAQSSTNSSIFHNPFREEEDFAEQVLQKHVSMTELQKKAGRKERKIICKGFKNGYCKKGAKCPFVHVQPQANAESSGQPISYSEAPMMNSPETKTGTEASRKKRVGVSDDLIPPKKALQAYEKLKS